MVFATIAVLIWVAVPWGVIWATDTAVERRFRNREKLLFSFVGMKPAYAKEAWGGLG